MKIGVPKERLPEELRVAISPDTIRKMTALGFDIIIESGAGEGAFFSDTIFGKAGAQIAADAAEVFGAADIVLKVRPPSSGDSLNEVSLLKSGTILISSLGAMTNKPLMEALARQGVTAFAMELLPRITRAQSMDILSSQSNLAGYKAIIDAAGVLGRAFPMMMTAAGTIAPAKVFVMGVGVAGLQAIATAKRMGAVVTATDVRPATKEQVESLGGKFLDVDPTIENDAQMDSGYAKEMPPEYLQKQKLRVSEHIKKQDVVVTTALIPGQPAPVLITEEMLKSMPAGSVVVDLAVEAGGNCEVSECGKTVQKSGVTIIGHINVPSRIAEDASTLFAKNLLNFITPLVDFETKELNIDWEDEIIQSTLICRDGNIVHSSLIGQED